MSTEKLLEALGRQVSRRDFLKGIAATLAALLGFPTSAYASVRYKCCNLCYDPSHPCPTGCPGAQDAGRWCWYCCCDEDGRTWQCCECKRAGAPCDGSCNGVYASWARPTMLAPELVK